MGCDMDTCDSRERQGDAQRLETTKCTKFTKGQGDAQRPMVNIRARQGDAQRLDESVRSSQRDKGMPKDP